MKKLLLKLEALKVESFTLDTRTDQRGTVEGHGTYYYDDPCGPTPGGCSGAGCGGTDQCDSYTCPGAGGECNKPSMWYNPCAK
jgi:hypothetical protein